MANRRANEDRDVTEAELMKEDQIRASRDTIKALVKWVKSGNVPLFPLLRPVEDGLLFIGENDYIMFMRREDIVNIAWRKIPVSILA